MAILDLDLQGDPSWVLLTEAPRLRDPGWCRDGDMVFLRCPKCNFILAAESEAGHEAVTTHSIGCGKCGLNTNYYLAGNGDGTAEHEGPQSKCCKKLILTFGTGRYCSGCWRKFV